MRKWTNGAGGDSSSAVQAFLATATQVPMFTLYRIELVRWRRVMAAGSFINAASPFKSSWLLTDFPGAVVYPPLGNFSAGVISHGSLNFSVADVRGEKSGGGAMGGDSQFEITWVPNASDILVPSYQFGGGPNPISPPLSALQGVAEGMFDGAFIYVYKVLMNTPTDASTYGVMLLTMGLVDKCERDGRSIKFTCEDPITHVAQDVPAQLIQTQSRFAAIDPLIIDLATGAHVSNADHGTGPQVVSGGTFSLLYPPRQPSGAFNNGVLVWLAGALAGMRRSIRLSVTDTGADSYTFYLSSPFPFDATIYDQGYAFGLPFAAYLPTSSLTSSAYYNGFPYVPNPDDGL